jgi:hypothetical protein
MEWSEKDLEGSGRGLIEVLSQHLPRGTVENLRAVSSLVDIRTKRLALVQFYLQTNLFCESALWNTQYRASNVLRNASLSTEDKNSRIFKNKTFEYKGWYTVDVGCDGSIDRWNLWHTLWIRPAKHRFQLQASVVIAMKLWDSLQGVA